MSIQSPDSIIAYRGRSRWVQSIEPVQLEDTPLQLEEQGVYLVTDGLADTGLVFAEHLCQTGTPITLILITAAEFPGKEQWPQWQAGDEDQDRQDHITTKIHRLQAMEEQGHHVFVFQADITDLDGMKTLLHQVREQVGRIHGLLHTADVPGEGLEK